MKSQLKRPLRVERLPWRKIDGRVVVVQPQAGQVHELNSVAAFFWEKSDGTRSGEELVALLPEEFDLDESSKVEAMSDAETFFIRLESQGLIRWQSSPISGFVLPSS